MGLKAYNAKRRFDVTPEPAGKVARAKGNTFVIQKHAASRLHYDLRLEMDGVMKSWAVTRGPSLVPGEKRLAVHVEDHPIEYNKFEGTIPKGEYGGGTVMIWDRGAWFAEGDARRAYEKGNLDVRLEGEKLRGSWHLVRMRKREGERQDPWLLIKSTDQGARTASDPDILEEMPLSVASGRSMDEITAGKPVKKRGARAALPAAAVWSSKAKPSEAMTDARKTARSSARPRQPKPRATAKKTREATKKSSRAAKASEGPQPPKAARRTTGAALPDFVPPCLALLSAAPPQGDSWLHEAKFDGYRIQARLDRGEVQLKTRRGLDWTHKFTPVAQELARLSAQQALIDGEVVIETNNVSSFSALQEALSAGSGDFIFYAFDLLHLDGVDLTGTPLIDRKQALAQLVKKTSGWALRLSEHFETEGGVLLRSACEMGLEGIISKLRDGAYRSGRNGDWVKTKCSERQEFVIIGFAPATNDPRAVGALILGYYEDEVLKYAGRVGTGYTHKSARELWQKLNPLVLEMSPIKPLPAEERGRGAIWVEPKLVAEIDFRGWTHGMRLRHPSFKALREDKLATEIVRERPVASPSAASVAPAKPAPSGRSKTAKRSAPPRKASAAPEANAAAQMHLTNPGRVYWEDVGLTKQGLADYYAAVWDWIAPHVTGRALSLVRCPEGARKECFFQKHASAGLDSKRLRLVPEDDDHVISIDNLDGLIALVQAGVLEIHVRGSTVERLDAANRIVFDLDPAPEVGWPQVIAAARDVRERLDALGLSAYLKTTGGKGLHVVVPIQYAEWDRVKAFTRAFAFEMASDSPAKYLATASKRERTGRIFVDYLRNSREATAICAYSTRARDGATVSVPITWQELGNLEVPNRYTVANIMPRLKRMKRDPWADIGREKQKLPELPRRRK